MEVAPTYNEGRLLENQVSPQKKVEGYDSGMQQQVRSEIKSMTVEDDIHVDNMNENGEDEEEEK